LQRKYHDDGAVLSLSMIKFNLFTNEIPLSSFKSDSALLLPRPYPGFQPLMFHSAATDSFSLNDIDKLQMVFEEVRSSAVRSKSFELETIFLNK